MKLSTLTQFSKNANRFKEVVFILTKYGLANWIKANDPDFIKGLLKRSGGENLFELKPETRLRMALTELGPTFIKLGQILSTRADLVGPEIADELTRLQADVPADDPDIVQRIVEQELGRPLKELFSEFDKVPMGSASIGQAHRAVLHSGEVVVVKVQHDGIEPKIIDDLEILKALAELAERYDPDLRLYQPSLTVAEFSRNLLRELDFRRELRSLNQFRENFKENEWVHIPSPYPEYSSQRVLTMEMLSGHSIKNKQWLHQENIDSQEFIRNSANMYLEMIFRDRFFHADPHPGNIWVLPGGRLGLLDFGMTGRLADDMREELEGILLAAVDNDPERVTDHVLRIADVPNNVDRSILKRDIDDFLSEYVNVTVEEIDLSTTLNTLTDILREHHILLPTSLSLLLRVLVMLEGTSRLLDRNFSLADLIKPYAVKSIQRRYSPKKILTQVRSNYRDWDRLMKIFPRELHDVIIRARDGKFDISIEHRSLEKVTKWMVHGILSAALFLGGSMIVSQEIPPLIWGISIIGATTSLIGLFLGFQLIRAMNSSHHKG